MLWCWGQYFGLEAAAGARKCTTRPRPKPILGNWGQNLASMPNHVMSDVSYCTPEVGVLEIRHKIMIFVYLHDLWLSDTMVLIHWHYCLSRFVLMRSISFCLSGKVPDFPFHEFNGSKNTFLLHIEMAVIECPTKQWRADPVNDTRKLSHIYFTPNFIHSRTKILEQHTATKRTAPTLSVSECTHAHARTFRSPAGQI